MNKGITTKTHLTKTKANIIYPSQTTQKTTIAVKKHLHPTIHIYEINNQDLKTLEDSSFNKAFYSCGLSVSLTAFFSFLAIIITLAPSDPQLYAIFSAIILVSIAFTIIFLILSVRCISKCKGIFKEIRNREWEIYFTKCLSKLY